MSGCSEIGKRIRVLRENTGLRQSDVADALHIARSNYAKIETGDRDIKSEYCIAIADYFHVTCDFLLRGIDAQNVEICERTSLTQDSIDVLSAYSDEKKISNDRNSSITLSATLYMINAMLQDKDLVPELTFDASEVIISKVFSEGYAHLRSHDIKEKRNERAGLFSAGLAIAKFFEKMVNDPRFIALFRAAYAEELNMFFDVHVVDDFDLDENPTNNDGM